MKANLTPKAMKLGPNDNYFTEELNSSCLFLSERDLTLLKPKNRARFLLPFRQILCSKTASSKTQISWNWGTLPKNVFYMKMIRRNVCIFPYKFHLLKKMNPYFKKIEVFSIL